MTKFVRASGLFAAMLALALAAGTSASAQDKKKKETKPAGTGSPVIEINESKDGKFRFSVRGADGKYLGGSSTGYASKADAIKAVDALKAALAEAKVVEKEKEKTETPPVADASKDAPKTGKDK